MDGYFHLAEHLKHVGRNKVAAMDHRLGARANRVLDRFGEQFAVVVAIGEYANFHEMVRVVGNE
jgi:hypothetical protein